MRNLSLKTLCEKPGCHNAGRRFELWGALYACKIVNVKVETTKWALVEEPTALRKVMARRGRGITIRIRLCEPDPKAVVVLADEHQRAARFRSRKCPNA